MAVVLAAGGFFGYRHVLRMERARYEKMHDEANEVLEKEKFDEALVIYQRYLDEAWLDTYKEIVRLNIAEMHMSKGDYQQAKDVFLELEKSGKLSLALYKGLAEAERGLGNRQSAAEYYRKAIEIRKQSGSPIAGDDVAQMERIAEALEGQQ